MLHNYYFCFPNSSHAIPNYYFPFSNSRHAIPNLCFYLLEPKHQLPDGILVSRTQVTFYKVVKGHFCTHIVNLFNISGVFLMLKDAITGGLTLFEFKNVKLQVKMEVFLEFERQLPAGDCHSNSKNGFPNWGLGGRRREGKNNLIVKCRFAGVYGWRICIC